MSDFDVIEFMEMKSKVDKFVFALIDERMKDRVQLYRHHMEEYDVKVKSDHLLICFEYLDDLGIHDGSIKISKNVLRNNFQLSVISEVIEE
jgi:hypothetical protein